MIGWVLTFVFLTVYAWMDWKKQQVWWPLSLYFTAAGVLLHRIPGNGGMWECFAGIGLGIMLLAVAWTSGQAIGYGDGLAIGACGALVGIECAFEAFFIALLLAACRAGYLLIRRRVGRKERLPFLPYLLLAFVLLGIFS